MRWFVQRGIDEQELQPDVNVVLLADILFGTLVFQMQTGALEADNSDERVGELWDQLVLGSGTDKARRRLKRARSAG